MQMQPDFEKANEIYFRLGIIYKQQAKYNQSLEVSWMRARFCRLLRSNLWDSVSSTSSTLLRSLLPRKTSGSKSAMSTSSRKT